MSSSKKLNKEGGHSAWVSCEICGCREWTSVAHSGCSPGADPWLRGTIEVSATELAGAGAVMVSAAAARLCGLVLGELVVVQRDGIDAPPLVCRLWVSRTAAPSAVVLYGRELESRWSEGLESGQTRSVSVRALRDETVVTVSTIQLVPPVDLNLSPAHTCRLLKQQFLHKLLAPTNRLVYWHYGKCLQFTISDIKSEQIISDKRVWYRLHNSTKWSIQMETESKPKKTYALGGVNQIIDEVESVMRAVLGSNTSRHLQPVRGLLLFGHSGTGKSAICRYLINKLSCYCVEVNGPAIFSKYFGETEKTMKNLFIEAEKNAPSIIFIDEIDTICPKRSASGTEQERRVMSALVSLLDSLHQNGSKVFVLATTNKPDTLDPALRRFGRLDRELEVPVPDRASRREIMHTILEDVPNTLSREDFNVVSDAAHGYVGADMLNLCTQASMRRMQSECDEKKLCLDDLRWALTVVKASAMREVLIEVPNVRWSDIGGQADLKMKLRQAVEWPLKHADRFKTLGIKPPNGVLMYGPPGCSKTMIAKALATESGLNFLSIKGPELFSKWVGESERAVRDLFGKARRVAPAIIFFDELDALGGERSAGGEAAGGVHERVLAQILTELDGVVPLQNVVVVAATNRPDKIDRALLRPGRLDRLVYVPLPDRATRADIFSIKLARMPTEDVSVDVLVDRTDGFSGAEVQAVCHEAALKALEEDINCDIVKFMHFEEVLAEFKPRTPVSLLKIYDKFSLTNRS